MDWRMRAACLHDDADLLPLDRTVDPDIDQAGQICGTCPVRARCLDWALSNGVASGIWGGRTEEQRHTMRAR